VAQLKIYQDEIKQQYTSHWDLDYMTSAQIEAALADGKRSSAAESCSSCAGSVCDDPSWWSRLVSRLIEVFQRGQ
jgi:hypothetical protein